MINGYLCSDFAKNDIKSILNQLYRGILSGADKND